MKHPYFPCELPNTAKRVISNSPDRNSAPPDRGLATTQMSGKKKDRFRITIGLACNADGSEKDEPIFIGRSKNPRCFEKKDPQSRGFYYRSNKTAWMTTDLFDEYVSNIPVSLIISYLANRWLKKLDLRMRRERRHICLLVDNFSAHCAATYRPTNIKIEFFEPNMTAFVQPCDAGIIKCFKALYRRSHCSRAIDLDNAGEREIYKINLLESMTIAKKAWGQVTSETIAHCWRHSQIEP